MERGSILKWVFLGVAVWLFMTYGLPLVTGKKASDRQPWAFNDSTAPAVRAPEERCSIAGPRFVADLSTRGASLRSLRFTDAKYTTDQESHPIDLVTTTLESRMPLRTDVRAVGAPAEVQQVAFDDLDWRLAAKTPSSCTFEFVDDTTRMTKTVSATERPFELAVDLSIENLSDAPKKHRVAAEQTSWRTKKETEGHLGRQSEHMTDTMAATTAKVERHSESDFDPDDFKDKEFTAEQWRRTPGDARFVATSSSYFTAALVPLEAPAPAAAETQIEEYFDAAKHPNKSDDPKYSHVFRSRLAWPEHELAPKQSVTYKFLSWTGPKERDVLAHAGGGGAHSLSDVINLGWFGVIGKVLVSYVYFLHKTIGSWGWAICLLTISVKILLFPLSISQIKNSAAMRRLKPEMDAINEKYKDDAAQKGLALQELWRKNKVANPIAGCMPVMLQMPVWFALYTSLQTAVELYRQPFGPFIPDLSAPGLYYIIPIVLGASSFLQQKIMPPQGDPAQQKMMMYMMPGIFTVMMLFLPAGLGVYMLTNTWLGIGQQLLVERWIKSRTDAGGSGEIEVRDKTSEASAKRTQDRDSKRTEDRELGAPPVLEAGKGKARVRG